MIAESYAALSRHEFPAVSPDSVFVAHNRAAAFGSTDLTAYIRAGWDLGQHFRPYIEAVHRLSDLAAVCSYAAHGISDQGFDAEWQGVNFVTIEGDTFNRCEFFDEADLDTAIAQFEELSRPTARLENAASQAFERMWACFATRDWEAMTEMVAADEMVDDRRRVVNAGIRRGRDSGIKELQAAIEIGFTIAMVGVIATRGDRLALTCVRASGRDPEAAQNDAANVVEIDADGRIAEVVVFDLDDFDSAIAELDARYLAGEAAAHADTWSVVAGAYAAFNRRELAGTTPEWANIDHRRGAGFAPGDMIAYIQAAWDDSPDTKIYIAAVHRLSKIGAVVTHVSHGISQEGFDAEWRDVYVLTVEGDLISRGELFDEADLNAAIARFDQLSRPAPQFENTASRVADDFQAYYAAGDWQAMTDVLAEDYPVTIAVEWSAQESDMVATPTSQTCGHAPNFGSGTGRRPSWRPAASASPSYVSACRTPIKGPKRSSRSYSSSTRSTPTSG